VLPRFSGEKKGGPKPTFLAEGFEVAVFASGTKNQRRAIPAFFANGGKGRDKKNPTKGIFCTLGTRFSPEYWDAKTGDRPPGRRALL